MATINHNPIYKTLKENLSYVSEAHKQIPISDLTTVMEYVTGDHAEVLYTKGHGCSCNPELAAEEFLSDREKYLERKKGAKLSGQTDAKKEIIAHHFYISFHKEDFVGVERMMKITDELIERTPLKEFKLLRAPHTNTDEEHVHLSVNAYSMDGKKKFCMNNKMLYTLRRELDHICYEYGLSLVEDKTLLKTDEEYAKWFAAVKAEGKVRIHKNRTSEEKKMKNKERRSKKSYVKKLPLRSIEEDFKGAVYYNSANIFGERIYFAAGGRFPSPKTGKPYRMKIWTEDGRKRSTVELLLLLIAVVLFDTQKYAQERNYYQPKVNVDCEIQRMIDGIAATREYGITDNCVLESKIRECGSNISSLKKAIYDIDKSLNEKENDDLRKERAAYLEKLKKYNKQYYQLMQVKALTKEVMTDTYRDNIYAVKPLEQERKLSLDDMIASAERKKGKGMQTREGDRRDTSIDWRER